VTPSLWKRDEKFAQQVEAGTCHARYGNNGNETVKLPGHNVNILLVSDDERSLSHCTRLDKVGNLLHRVLQH
jgi:hypothetical protein